MVIDMSDEDKKVVQLVKKPKQELVWECLCGEQTFYLMSSKNVRCYGCGQLYDIKELTEVE